MAVLSGNRSCLGRFLAGSTIRSAFTALATFTASLPGLPPFAWLAPLPGFAALAWLPRLAGFTRRFTVALAA